MLIPLVLTAALAGTVACTPTPSASVTVSPTTARPGETVIITLTGCSDPSMGGRAEGQLVGDGTTAHTPIEPVDLAPAKPGGHTLTGTTVITPGTGHTIYAVCAGDPGNVTEVDLHGQSAGVPHADATRQTERSRPTSPR
ncbi:hypothetical protein G6045_03210 [Streptomyces sp. YC504]|uniref:Uncharacterized protein n=1 Tax=Streptomyces mesophilus TaxID=1775132 RepID=A0A6G4XCW7_9ACTN|nr:hypothetical protein [Streptomyces mesophilus]NGO74700.1 hypothetical protein [Streptomyces mesophilus]